MSAKDEIHAKLGTLINKGKKEHLQLMGADLAKLRDLEKRQSADFKSLEKSLRKDYKDSGKELANRHLRSLTRSQKISARKIEHAIRPNHQLANAEIYRYLCHCLFPNEADYRDTSEDITIYPASGYFSQGAASFNASERSAQLFASADSPYSGESAGATVSAEFKFSFTPDNDGTYCIRPVAQLNGYWMLWSGVQPGCQDFSSLPVFGFNINIKIRVEQLANIVITKTHDAINTPAPYAYSGAIDYDSNILNELDVEVDLLGGDQTIVFVECELQVFSNNGLHSRIDLQTSPHFYFKVPMVKWGSPCTSMFQLFP